jgi:hypothetical protein
LRIKVEPVAIKMPYGTALAVVDASSLMCKQESKQLIVRMDESQASINAQPVGQVAKFCWYIQKGILMGVS